MKQTNNFNYTIVRSVMCVENILKGRYGLMKSLLRVVQDLHRKYTFKIMIFADVDGKWSTVEQLDWDEIMLIDLFTDDREVAVGRALSRYKRNMEGLCLV